MKHKRILTYILIIFGSIFIFYPLINELFWGIGTDVFSPKGEFYLLKEYIHSYIIGILILISDRFMIDKYF
jgi:hypothetical protein